MATVAQIADPQGAARFRFDLRMTSLRWSPQELTNVATVAQMPPPLRGGARGLGMICVWRHCAGPPSSSRTWRQLRRSQPPRDDEVSW